MKYQSFCMRVLCLLLILAAVIGYNSMQKKDTQEQETQEITQLKKRVDTLEEQQKEMLAALEEAAKNQETAKSQRRQMQRIMQQKKTRQTVKMQKVRMILKTFTKTVLIPDLHRDSAVRSRFR